jgi:hypothetical protein
VLVGAAIVIGLAGGLETVVALGDRQLFVPPPESVAESFVRHLASNRYDRAHALLTADVAARTTVTDLENVAAALRRRAGAIVRVEGEPKRARVLGDRSEATVELGLDWTRGRWRISRWMMI